MPLDALSALTLLGGTADWAALMVLPPWPAPHRHSPQAPWCTSSAGGYVLTDADRARSAAQINGVLALRSAAMHYGWPVRFPPPVPEIGVPRKRHVRPRKGIRRSGSLSSERGRGRVPAADRDWLRWAVAL